MTTEPVYFPNDPFGPSLASINRIAFIGLPASEEFIAEAQARFAVCNQLYADIEERDERDWLTFLAGSQWGDEAPNRLFGAWLNHDGEAV